jgi:hypothetical protein
MAHLGNYIAGVIADERAKGKDTTPASMAARMGIKPSMMSRFLNDPRPRGVHLKTLEKMVRGISYDPFVRAGLRAALLKDLVGLGEDAKLVEIRLRSTIANDKEGHYHKRTSALTPDYTTLSKTAQRVALDARSLKAINKLIEQCATSKKFRRFLIDLLSLTN